MAYLKFLQPFSTPSCLPCEDCMHSLQFAKELAELSSLLINFTPCGSSDSRTPSVAPTVSSILFMP